VTDNSESNGPIKIKVEDRRHWARVGESDEETPREEVVAEEAAAAKDEEELGALRDRAEAAEEKLRDYASAFQKWKEEQEQVRMRLERDLETRVSLRFGELVADLLELVDDLDRSLEHSRSVKAAAPFVKGVALARERFLSTLERHGVKRMELDGGVFDPNLAEAVAVESVDDPAADGTVVRTVRSGYRLGDRVLRVARVAVGRANA